jgi:hypothetical protein
VGGQGQVRHGETHERWTRWVRVDGGKRIDAWFGDHGGGFGIDVLKRGKVWRHVDFKNFEMF